MPEPDATTKLPTPPPAGAEGGADQTSPQPLVPGVEPGHLIPPAEAAALSFLGVLAIGAVLLVAVKLQYPNLGAGANTIDVFSSVVILGLAMLRVPVHIGDLTFTVLPLGALVGVFFVVRWACRLAIPSAPPRRAPIVGGFFAVMALLAALVFRFRFEPDAIFAGAFGAAVAGFVWVSLFAVLAFVGAAEPLNKAFLRRLAARRRTNPSLFEGLRAGALMLVAAGVAGVAAGLLWAIVVLLSGGGPHGLDAGDLVAALVYVTAFAPNLVVAIVSLSLGAPVDVGAGLTVQGKVRGDVEQWAVLSDGAGLSVLLLLLPLTCCAGAGYWARRNTERPEKVVQTLAVAALVFASVLAFLGWLGEARLGAELASSRGFGVVAPRAWLVFLLGLVWAGGAGFGGWMLAEKRPRA